MDEEALVLQYPQMEEDYYIALANIAETNLQSAMDVVQKWGRLKRTRVISLLVAVPRGRLESDGRFVHGVRLLHQLRVATSEHVQVEKKMDQPYFNAENNEDDYDSDDESDESEEAMLEGTQFH
jgi:hypothetical protein